MVPRPSPEQLRAYARRDWSALATAKQRGVDVLAPTQALELSQRLWQHMRAIDPSWPDEEQRRADFEHHLRLVEIGRRLRDAGFPR